MSTREIWKQLPSPTCDQTTAKDLRRTPANASLWSFSDLPLDCSNWWEKYNLKEILTCGSPVCHNTTWGGELDVAHSGVTMHQIPPIFIEHNAECTKNLEQLKVMNPRP
jgi:hypothetical protein